MATFTEVRLVFTLPTGRVIKPSWYMGYFATDTAIDATELQAVAEAAAGAVATSGLMAGFTTGVVFREVETQNFHIAPPGTEQPPPNPDGKHVADTITFTSDAADIPGTRAVDTLPPQNTVVYQWNSVTAGTQGRNWTNFPAIGEDEVDSSGLIVLTRRDQLKADINTIQAAAAGAADPDAQVVVVSSMYNRLEELVRDRVNAHVRTQRVRYA